MGDKSTPQAPALPKDLPEGLRKFFSCESKEVMLKDGELSWLSVSGKDLIPADMASVVPDKILNGTVHPSLAITPDPSAPGKASIKIGIDVPPFGTVGPSIPMSIENGQLTADTSGLPQALKDRIDPAIKNLNDWFKTNGYGFGPATFGAGTTKLTKIDLKPAGQTAQPPTPPPAPPKPKATPVAPAPVTPPPVTGGCLGILFLVLAVVGIGAILFFGGPALGLFGAPPIGSPSPSQVAAATPAPTPPPTPEPQIVRSSDGAVTLTIPYGSVASGTSLTVTPLDQTHAPPELVAAGVTFRGFFYDVGPANATLTGPIGYDRIIDLTALRIDPETQGYPLIQLAERTSDAKWSWLPDQTKRVGGPDGMGDETKPTQSATLTRVGEVFGFSRGIYLHRDPYPEEGTTFAVGAPIRIGAKITGSNGQAIPTDLRPIVANVIPTVSLIAPGVVYSDPLVLDDPTQQSTEITATCTQPGDFVVGLQLDVTPGPVASDSLIAKLGLGTAPPTTVAWTTGVHCGGEVPSLPPPGVTSGCVFDRHTPVGSDPSYLGVVVYFAPGSQASRSALFHLSYHFGDLAPREASGPISGGRAELQAGINSYGIWTWDRASATSTDGTTTDLTADFERIVGPSVTVTSAQENLAGNACP